MQKWSLGALFVTAVACTADPAPVTGPDAASDVAADVAASDTPSPHDVVAPDAPLPDISAPDAPPPDIIAPDAPPPDVVALDAPLADISAPDAPLPDLVAPDAADVALPCGAAAQPCCPAGASSPPCAAGLVCARSGACEPCPEGLSLCAGSCVDLSESDAHCGRCGNACAAGQFCSEGTCRSPCAAPLVTCMGACVRVGGDPAHCTACGAACALPHATAGCAAGACTVAACDEGYGDCDGNAANGCEADLGGSAAHCGACGNACAAGGVGTASCVDGRCALTCPAGFGDCDGDRANGCETSLAVNTAHCGRCGNACPAGGPGLGAVCSAGVCGTASCAAGTADCDGNRANGCETATATSMAHCGACGNACTLANASAACVGGACALTACNAGFGDCDGNPENGCETSLRTASAHCGACGNACRAAAGATVACVAGACAVTACDLGVANCNGSVTDGCETNTATSVAHCGACGAACSFAHAAATCVGGRCARGACVAPWSDCNGMAADGCEVNTGSNPLHCGACGRRCALAHVTAHTCATGVCGVSTCEGGWGNCDGAATNGCEVNLNTSNAHCGACGRACPSGRVCSAGSCVLACAFGLTRCGGTCTSTALDPNHCGACGRVCTVANGTPACVSGTCRVGSCDAGWADCDGDPSNGCEVNTAASNSHCGACGRTCAAANGSAACNAGVCEVTACNAGFADCDRSAANGCEARLVSDRVNCGTCGRVCATAHGTSACMLGVCTFVSCNIGWGNCDGNLANGCEADLTSTSNCGRCGNACPTRAHASTTCSAGTCGFSCNRDYGDCDGDASNGCERHTFNDDNNCGRCGRNCGIFLTCRERSCSP